MKKALLLLLAGLSAAGAALASPLPPAANVNFASERGVPFAVMLDGRPLTRGLARQVHAERLAPGAHYAEFSVPTAYGGAVRLRSRVWLEPGLETTFVLRTRPGRPLDLRQAGAVALYYGRGASGYGNGRNDRYDDRRDRGYDRHDGYQNGAAYPPDPYGTRPDDPRGGYDSNGRYYDNAPLDGRDGSYSGPAGSYRLLTAPDVDDLAQALGRTSFEEERLQLARQALSQRSLRAEDLAQLLRGLRFDGSRVEFAKFAYPHVVDQANFYRVYSSFDSSLKADEVRQAVGAR